QIASASGPLRATTTSKYSAVRRASNSLTLAGTSSTTRIRAVIDARSRRVEKMTDGFEEFADRDRRRQIGFAPALAYPLLVPFHRERGDGDPRNRLELRVVLEPFRHLEPRDFRQLNVHQDQIRAMLAGEVERLDAVAGTERLVAVRLQQIVEELHVELVVLHDQDGLGHPPFLRLRGNGASGLS